MKMDAPVGQSTGPRKHESGDRSHRGANPTMTNAKNPPVGNALAAAFSRAQNKS
jgi:hypothetical protein